MQQFDFFQLTLDIYARNNLKAILQNAGISGGKTYQTKHITSAIKLSVGVKPQLRCESGYLTEIRMCLNTRVIPQYINCPNQGQGNCGNQINFM